MPSKRAAMPQRDQWSTAGEMFPSRVFGRLKRRFPERIVEWLCAAELVGWGAVFYGRPFIFSNPAMGMLRKMAPAELWGVCLMTVGALWIVGLVVNGARHKTTSKIRATCATAGLVTFLLLALGFAVAYPEQMTGLWLVTLILHVLAAAYSVFRAMVDHERG
ncbi:hypothetical protein [Pararhizobium mangrovi]|uniref:Uncharacterized protein n=1 Tax=Pararhizobium mangrovi TaxID=2590452 RepID=A0A506UB73_9HYPH|nr:hypothetical protein [Pararhizobium mangrovi]TPW31180.1 hypothetical protein FJU11_02990 [Pararhizobium mangrovi]